MGSRIVFYNGLDELPNSEGFRFRGWLHNGDLMPCIVMRNELGMHYAASEETRRGVYDLLRGWTPYMNEPSGNSGQLRQNPMTLPKNVEDAVKRLDTACVDGRVMPSDDAWQTIRAHLVSQEAEIADLISKRDFLLRHYNDAESRVAAANALLRNIAGCQWFNREAPATVELIDAHLQGAGDEA